MAYSRGDQLGDLTSLTLSGTPGKSHALIQVARALPTLLIAWEDSQHLLLALRDLLLVGQFTSQLIKYNIFIYFYGSLHLFIQTK